MRKRNYVLLLLGGLVSSNVYALPVSWQGGFGIMTWNQPYLNDIWTTYSFLPNAAIAARYMRMGLKNGSDMNIYLPQADFRLYRRNAKTFQSNIYAIGGYGQQNQEGSKSGVGLAGLEADIENRECYAAAGFQSVMPAKSSALYQSNVRLGLAAYPAEFDELGTWFIAQYQNNPDLRVKEDVTPMLRFMYRNFLAEVGVGITHYDGLFNFTVHF